MDCEPQSPLNAPLPRTAEERTADLEEAVNRIHLTFEKEGLQTPQVLSGHGRYTLSRNGRSRMGPSQATDVEISIKDNPTSKEGIRLKR